MNENDESQDGEAKDSTACTFESGREEREAHYPEAGYNLVEIDLMRPPGEALTLLSHHLTLSSITIRPATEFEDYVVYDQHGHAYDHDELQTPSEAVEQLQPTLLLVLLPVGVAPNFESETFAVLPFDLLNGRSPENTAIGTTILADVPHVGVGIGVVLAALVVELSQV